MEHVWLTVLGLMLVLTLAVLLLPLANRLNFPYTVLLAVAGVALGALTAVDGMVQQAGPLGDPLRALGGLNITSEMVLFVFLPALVFESAMSIDVRRLMEDVGPILFLAVVGLLISTFAVGLALHWASGVALVACLLFGCIVSATDPVAVVALFRDLGAPKRLTILVEGESLFNDATAIVLFTILLAMLVGGGEVSLLGGAWDFVRVFVGGVLVGYVVARIFTWAIRRLRRLTLVCITLTITLAYLSFILAEHYLHVSGVMAVVTAGLVVGSIGRTAIPPEGFHALHEAWGQLGFWANSIIFVLVGLAVPELLAEAEPGLLWLLVLAIAVATAARAAVIYGLMPLLSLAAVGEKVSGAFRTVILWGGLRGAVALALALAIAENAAVDVETRHFIVVLVTGFVLFTLFVQATTIRGLMSWLGLDQLAPTDRAIRDRAMMQTMHDVSSGVARAVQEQEIEPQIGDALSRRYDERAAAAARELPEDIAGAHGVDWVAVGLATMLAQEKHRYLEKYGDGFVSAPALRELLVKVEDIADALKSRHVQGYREAVTASLAYDRQFLATLQLQRRFGWSQPLSNAMALRFEVLAVMRMVIREELEHGRQTVHPMVGEAAYAEVERLVRERLEQVNLCFASIRLQYPDYARRIEEQHLGRVALRLEEADYRMLLEQALISQEVHADLVQDLEERRRALEARPKLDLGLEPDRLVRQVPFLSQLSDERMAALTRLLKPRLVVPDEMVVRKGETGNAMYFISSGAVQVDLQPEPVTLGSGDFFGEIALLAEQPRNADVRSMAFCQLLALERRDFLPFLEANPDLKRRIEAVAAERLRA